MSVARTGRAALAALALAAALPAGASAHAVLERTVPERGATVERPPQLVEFEFDEAVEGSFGAVRVFDSHGRRVDGGELVRPDGSASSVATRLPADLPDGAYTATYRVVSADAHPVSGGFVFTVGRAGGRPAAPVNELLDSGEAGPVTDAAFGVVRFTGYAATALAVGIAVFLALVWAPALGAVAGAQPRWRSASDAFARRAQRVLAVAVVAGAAATALGIVLQGATAGGTSFWAALDASTIGAVLDTRFGTVWGLRLLAWCGIALALAAVARRGGLPVLRPDAVGAAGLVLRGRPSRPLAACVAVLLGYLVVAPALSGHASAQSPAWLLVPADAVHVAAMCLWAGGLIALVAVLPAATRRLEAADRTRLLAAALMRFSPLALACAAALPATGIVQSVVYLDGPADLWTSGFGRTILAKAVLLLALAGLGAVNRRRAVPGLRALAASGGPPGGAGRLLRRTLRAEVALLAVVLALSAVLVALAPAPATGQGPHSSSAMLGPARLEVVVDPADRGRNEIHLYLLDARDGSQFDAARDVRLELSLADPQVTLDPELLRAGPGHYVAPDARLPLAGDWELTVDARVSRYEAYSARVEVPVQ